MEEKDFAFYAYLYYLNFCGAIGLLKKVVNIFYGEFNSCYVHLESHGKKKLTNSMTKNKNFNH